MVGFPIQISHNKRTINHKENKFQQIVKKNIIEEEKATLFIFFSSFFSVLFYLLNYFYEADKLLQFCKNIADKKNKLLDCYCEKSALLTLEKEELSAILEIEQMEKVQEEYQKALEKMKEYKQRSFFITDTKKIEFIQCFKGKSVSLFEFKIYDYENIYYIFIDAVSMILSKQNTNCRFFPINNPETYEEFKSDQEKIIKILSSELDCLDFQQNLEVKTILHDLIQFVKHKYPSYDSKNLPILTSLFSTIGSDNFKNLLTSKINSTKKETKDKSLLGLHFNPEEIYPYSGDPTIEVLKKSSDNLLLFNKTMKKNKKKRAEYIKKKEKIIEINNEIDILTTNKNILLSYANKLNKNKKKIDEYIGLELEIKPSLILLNTE